MLDINLLAREYGWQLKDCHGFNLVFDGGQPVWVDLGSFVLCARDTPGWSAGEEFLRGYLYPLRIWADGSAFIARRLQAASELMSHADYGLYRWPWLRWGLAGVYQRFKTHWHRHYRQLSHTPDERLRTKLPTAVAPLVIKLKAWGWLPGQGFPARALRARLAGSKYRPATGFWSEYQSAGTSFVATPRFLAIIALLKNFRSLRCWSWPATRVALRRNCSARAW
ncbi:MAG: hypothetical protein WDM96_12645 [Lacunisphaera sp.]